MTAIGRRRRDTVWLGVVPPVVIVAAWSILATSGSIPTYKLPSPIDVLAALGDALRTGSLVADVSASVARLAIAFAIGASLGLAIGLAVARSPAVARFLQPLLTFLQSIAGVAWIPLAVVWFGIGAGPVTFVIANAAFFIVLTNTIAGVRSLPPVVLQAAATLGAGRGALLRDVIVPGAFVSVIAGLESGLAFAWRALVAAELIAGSDGIGYRTVDASRRFESATVVLGILVIGVLWIAIELAFLRPLRRRTVERWGMTSHGA